MEENPARRRGYPANAATPAILAALALTLASCVSLEPGAPASEAVGSAEAELGAPVGAVEFPGAVWRAADPQGEAIATHGRSIVGLRSLNINGKRFTMDCTGTVLAAYWLAGYDLGAWFPRYTGNGVKRLHDLGLEEGLLETGSFPRPGDILIWDDTYDMDGDRAWGDPFTHAGLVVESRPDGQVTYVHYHYTKGIVLESMNLLRPDTHTDPSGTVVNSPLRLRADRPIRPEAWLSSHLLRNWASLYRLPSPSP